MRDRLIELLLEAENKADENGFVNCNLKSRRKAEFIADHLLSNGVIVPPKKGCEYCKGKAYTKRPLTVITKYGRRIELAFEFCPNCGRKMNAERSNENAE